MPEHFHFLQPAWFFMLIPLAWLILWLRQADNGKNDPWQKVIDKDLLPWLRVNISATKSRLPLWLLAVAWIIAVIALANPVWQKLPQPVFQTDKARVIVLDLSLSMNSTDLKPARIDRARFKVRDILAKQQEGVIGLVVFAGDAFVVSPLTRDGDTIAAMLGALQPGIMPVQGSRADLGLLKAGELLQQAGRLRGEVLLLADSYSDKRTIEAAKELRQEGVVTSVLGIGTEQGAPLSTGRGDFLRDSNEQIITTRLDVQAMQELASAGGGDYVSLAADDSDIDQLMTERVSGTRHQSDPDEQAARWRETGPWLAILLVPLAALAFRRGWLVTIALLVTTTMPVEQANAFSLQDLWERRDQQAHKALLEGDLERASQLATDPLRKGAAAYRKGDYEAALESFSAAAETASDAAEADYNKGNALAKLGRYEDAIAAYGNALAKRPEMSDAKYNREVLEKLLAQQQDKQQDGEQKQGQQDGSQQQNQPGSAQKDSNQQQGAQADNQQGGQQENPQQAGSASGNEQKPGQNDENAFAKAAEQAAQRAEDEVKQSAQDAAQQSKQQQLTAAEQDKQNSQNSSAVNAQSNSKSASQATTPADEKGSAQATAEQLSSEEQLAAEQWLRRIPDDPAGLLRRKLRYQYIQRGGSSGNPAEQQPW